MPPPDHPFRSIGEAAAIVARFASTPGHPDMLRHVSLITDQINDQVHRLDLALLDGQFATEESLSAMRLETAADKLRRLADDLDTRRAKLIAAEPVFPFNEAAE